MSFEGALKRRADRKKFLLDFAKNWDVKQFFDLPGEIQEVLVYGEYHLAKSLGDPDEAVEGLFLESQRMNFECVQSLKDMLQKEREGFTLLEKSIEDNLSEEDQRKVFASFHESRKEVK